MRLVDADEIAYESIDSSDTDEYFAKYGTGIFAVRKEDIDEMPTIQPEIIYCKDCRKHNKRVGFDENFHTVWKEDACPLVSWRGKAQGHEFDYQFCACAERREVTT